MLPAYCGNKVSLRLGLNAMDTAFFSLLLFFLQKNQSVAQKRLENVQLKDNTNVIMTQSAKKIKNAASQTVPCAVWNHIKVIPVGNTDPQISAWHKPE